MTQKCLCIHAGVVAVGFLLFANEFFQETVGLDRPMSVYTFGLQKGCRKVESVMTELTQSRPNHVGQDRLESVKTELAQFRTRVCFTPKI